MDNYLIYIIVAALTIASPGPGVILTIVNSLRYGFAGALTGILGVSLGMLCVALISATSLGLILASSAIAFNVLKYLGAIYLIYLGLKLWRSAPTYFELDRHESKTASQRFIQGISITLFNPKPIFFFMSLFPQFINPQESYIGQFIVLSLTFSLLVITIHCFYGLTANLVRFKLTETNMGAIVSKVSGSIFVFFGIGLAVSNR